MIDYRINTFLTLYDTMNYRETGVILNMTQPAVTQQIHALEREYGVKLFCYNRRVLSRTPAADKLAVCARSMIQNDRLLREELAQQDPHIMRVGATKSIGEFVLDEIVIRYLANPSNGLELTVDNTKQLLTMLEKNELDFAVVEGSFDKQRYGYMLMRREPFVGICAKGHSLAGREVEPEEILDQVLILREKGSGTRAIFENVLSEAGYSVSQFRRNVCISSMAMICRLVAADCGISFVYKTAVQRRRDLAVFHLKGLPLQHEFNFVFLKDTPAKRFIETFLGETLD